MSDAQPQSAGPGAVPDAGAAPTTTPAPAPAAATPSTPALGSAMVADQLAIDIGRAVLAVLARSLKEGKLPPELAQIATRAGHEGLFSALERNQGQTPVADSSGANIAIGSSSSATMPASPARPEKKKPGTVTIRAAVRRAQELAMAPPGSDLAHLRLAFLAVLVTVVAVAVAVTYVLSFVKW